MVDAPLLRRLLPDLVRWTWRDVTDGIAHHVRVTTTRYVEVEHDGGHTIVALDEDGDASVWVGVDLDWCDVVAADVRGARRHEADLDVLEAAQLPRVA